MKSRSDWRRPLAPIGYGRQTIDEGDVDAVVTALRGDHLTQGPLVRRFEEDLARATGAPHAVSVANGTAALHVAIAALGLGPGARAVTSANTFLASATAALHAGLEVDFVDVEPATGNLDPARLAERLERGARVDLVVAVHFAGRACDLDALLALKERFGFRLVVDACHALGGTARVGGRALRVGEVPGVDATALSFHAVKHVTTGEGGAVLFARGELARRARRFADHGLVRDTDRCPFAGDPSTPPWFAALEGLGYNYRLTEIQAALGRSQLARLPDFVARRRELAHRYDALLTGCEKPELEPATRSASTASNASAASSASAPKGAAVERDAHGGHAWHLYVVRVAAEERDPLMAFLREGGIGTQLHYYPVPLQPYFRAGAGLASWRVGRPWTEADFPNAVEHARRSLSLPLYPSLADHDQDRVIAAFAEWRNR